METIQNTAGQTNKRLRPNSLVTAFLLCLVGSSGCQTAGQWFGDAASDPSRATGFLVKQPEKVPPATDSDTGVPPATPTPVIPRDCAECRIDLETALARAGVDNPTIAIAAEAVSASLALQL